MDWLFEFAMIVTAANAVLLFVNIRLMRQLYRLHLVWVVLCTKAYEMRGWPLHRLILRGVTMEALDEVEGSE